MLKPKPKNETENLIIVEQTKRLFGGCVEYLVRDTQVILQSMLNDILKFVDSEPKPLGNVVEGVPKFKHTGARNYAKHQKGDGSTKK